MSIQQSKTYELINSLSSKERKRLRQFLTSPYFNTKEEVVMLFDLINQDRSDKRSKSDHETIQDDLNGLKSNSLSKILNSLNELTLTFLGLEFQLDEFDIQLMAYRETKKRRVSKQAGFLQKKLSKLLANQPISVKHYRHSYLLEEAMFEGFENKTNRLATNSLNDILNSLDEYHLIYRLYFFCELLSRSAIINHDISNELIKKMKVSIDTYRKNHDNTFIQLYSHLFCMFTTREQEISKQHFHEAYDVILEQNNLLSNTILQVTTTYLLNFCIRKINESEPEYLKQYLNVIDLKIKLDAFLDNNALSPHRFKNIITAGIHADHGQWVESFIEEYESYLPHKSRSNYVDYAKAFLHYHRKQYDKAAKLLIAIPYLSDPYFGVSVRKLTLKTMYEAKNGEDLDAHAEALKKFISRNKKVLGVNAEPLNLFVNYFRRLIKWQNDSKQLDKLLDELSTQSFADKEWIENKLKELTKALKKK